MVFSMCFEGFRDTVNCPQLKDTFGNLMLSNAIQEAGNVVLVTKVLQADTLLPKICTILLDDPIQCFRTMPFVKVMQIWIPMQPFKMM